MNYVLGVAKENSENAISDNLETPNVLNVLPSFPRNCHLRRKIPRAKIILYSLDLRMTFCQNFFLQDWFRNKFGV
jgi:hypothetical protein